MGAPRGGVLVLCTVEGCGQTHKARGYCATHYTAWRRHGDPLVNLYPNRVAPPTPACELVDCGRTRYGHDLCRLHYRRLVRFGSTDLPGPKVCTECDRPAKARGLCDLHVKRLYAHGTTEPRYIPTDEERFWAKVDKQAGRDDCWEWQASRHPGGHGYAVREGKVVYAHRYSLEMHLGRRLAPGAMACHHCDNPPCVNPAHLYEGDAQTNSDDMWRRGRANPRGRRSAGAA